MERAGHGRGRSVGGAGRAAAAVLMATLVSAAASGAVGVPARPHRYVTDLAGVTDSARMSALNERLADFERQTSNQIVVYVDRRLPAGTSLEEFSSEALKAWGVGQKGKDNGAVLFVFVDDRKMRIEVGYGLEGVIPDARAQLILDAVLIPRFRQKDFNGGVEAAAQELMSAARGEPFRGTGRTAAESTPVPGWRTFLAWALAPLLGLGVGFLVHRSARRLGLAALAGLGTSSVSWIFFGAPLADSAKPLLLGATLLMCGASVALPIGIGKAHSSGGYVGRRRVGVQLLQAGSGLLPLYVALMAAGGLGLPTWRLAGLAVASGILCLVVGGFLKAKDLLEIVTLGIGRLAFAAAGIAGVYLAMSASFGAPLPGRQLAVDTAVAGGLVFFMALILAHSRGWRMGPSGPVSGAGWSISAGGSSGSSGGSWGSSSGSSWSSSSSSSSSSSFSGGGGSSGGGGASGSW